MVKKYHEESLNGYVSSSDERFTAPPGRVTPVLAITALIAAFGSSFPHGWNTGVLNAPSELIKDFLNETVTERTGSSPSDSVLDLIWSLTVAIYLIGGCFGAFSVVFYADKFGRKKGLLICHVFGFVAAILFGFCDKAGSFEMLIIGRFIVGYGCGAGSGLVPMYLTEVAPVNLRGAMGVMHQLLLTVGILCSQILGLNQVLGHPDRWPILLALTAVPCLVSLIILPFMPESPRYLLVNKDNREAAEEAVRRFRGTDDVTWDLEEMVAEHDQQKLEPKWSYRKLLGSSVLRLPLVIVVGINLAQQLSGINVVFYYSSDVFLRANIPDEYVQYAVMGTGIVNVSMTLISIPFMEKFGRRVMLLGGMVMMLVAQVVLTIALALQDKAQWLSYVSIICTMIFVVGFSIGLGSIPQFLGAELFKQGPRPPAMSLAAFTNWFGNVLVAITFPSMANLLGPFSFVVYFVILTSFTLFFWWKLPETKNKTYEEIYNLFASGEEGTQVELQSMTKDTTQGNTSPNGQDTC